MNRNIKAHIALLITNLIYGANYTIAKEAMPEYILPSGFILLRVSGALLLFVIFHRLMVKESVDKIDMLRLATCGLFGVAVNQLLFFKGLSITNPINAAIIMTINPVMVLLFASFLIREVITLKRTLGIILGIGGAVLLITYNSTSSFSLESSIGDLWIFLNAASYGIYLVIVKPLMNKYNPLTVIMWVFGFGLLYVLPFGFSELTQVRWTTLPMPIVLAMSFVVIFTTFAAYLLNIHALKVLSPTVVSYYIYLQPLLASIVALMFAKDVLSMEKIVAAALIFAGVALVSTGTNSKHNATISGKS
ncbi:MAG: EamA family transporter [Bacteroidetes bacterium]|nr:MAG: EamA family transporter [Bacteroidota bacterium]